MQIVFLSARPPVMAETWSLVRQRMPWIDRAVVCVPERLAREIDGGPDCTVVLDEDVTGLTARRLRQLDHTSRNTLLRRHLVATAAVDDTFLMSDDDYRPLVDVPPSTYLLGERHRLYEFYDLRSWPGNSTSFDAAQHRSAEILTYLDAPCRAYGSHMPQVISKELYLEAFERLRRLTDSDLFCEWSVYGNLATHHHPEHFSAPTPFVTLGWPQFIGQWPWWVRPSAYLFENYYPEMYEPGALFFGLEDDANLDGSDEHLANEKVRRWLDAGQATLDLRFDWASNPWTRDSAARRAAFGMLRLGRAARSLLTSDQSDELRRLTDDLRRLTDQLAGHDRDQTASPSDPSTPIAPDPTHRRGDGPLIG